VRYDHVQNALKERVQLRDLQLKQVKAKAKAQEREEDDMYF